MKVIGIYGNYGGSKPSELPGVYMMSDSSLLKDGKPFFVPDFAERFVAYPTVVVQICRLGKNIAKKFAHRYYDKLTVGLAVEAEGLKEPFAGGDCGAGALCRVFDGAAIMGDFVDVAELAGGAGDAAFEVNVEGGGNFTGSTALLQRDIDEIIEYISRYMTLKIGDYVFVCRPSEGLPLAIGMNVVATLGRREVVRFKVK